MTDLELITDMFHYYARDISEKELEKFHRAISRLEKSHTNEFGIGRKTVRTYRA